MPCYRYIKGIIDSMRSSNELKSRQALKYFPSSIERIYSLTESAGFSPSAYRNSWPDLIANLPSETWSTSHFIEYIETEVTLPRRFPIDVDFIGLEKLAKDKTVSRYSKSSLTRSLIQAQIDYDTKCIEDPQFWLFAIDLLSTLGSPVLVFGDSHSLIYRQTVRGITTTPVIPLTILCGGGSASGLPKTDSRSGYGNMIRTVASAVNEAHKLGALPLPVAFAFGQVDMEFVHTYRRLRERNYDFDDAALERFTIEFARAYVGWIADLQLAHPVVFGINPPCIDDIYISEAYLIQMQVYVNGRLVDGDDSLANFIQNFGLLKFPSKEQRTLDHERLNQILRVEAERQGLVYADSFSRMLGKDHCILPSFACASDGTASHVGLTGKDIHVGGPDARKAKAALLRSVPRLTATGYRKPS